MYPTLNAEIARLGMSKKTFSKKCDIPYSTFLNKINGDAPFTFNECIRVKKALNTNLTVAEIFLKNNTIFNV